MSEELAAKLDAIWADDRLGRRGEAQLLLDYIESVATRPVLREDSQSFTLAIDVGYGEGKTFFLRRLQQHLAITHPVAFVDAWADDTLDQPLTALAATLETALKPLKAKPAVKSKLANVISKTGNVAKAAALGALRRGVAYVISDKGADAVSAALNDAPSDIVDSAKAAAAIGEDVVAATVAEFSGVAPGKVMRDRIDAFEDGKKGIQDLKASLRALVDALKGQALTPPIIIIIDELDRCRPTYAVKLLEEIKHIFDVPGLIFVFGMHGEQLSNSMSAAYGAKFDGASYLRRFITRRYKLRTPRLRPLVTELLKQRGLIDNKQLDINFWLVKGRGFQHDRGDLDDIVAKYFEMYEVPVREVFHLIDALQTSAALIRGQPLYLPYYLPLLISRHLQPNSVELVSPRVDPQWEYAYLNESRELVTVSPWALAQTFHQLFKLPLKEFNDLDSNDTLNRIAWSMKGGRSGLNDPSNYDDLIEAVGRFDGPST